MSSAARSLDWPLNRDRPFSVWTHFDPGVFLDMNPTVAALSDGRMAVIFCRYPVPPVPGTGSIWGVLTDDQLRPTSRPVLLIGAGIDPRVVSVGGRNFLVFAAIERDGNGAFSGSSVVLCEFTVSGDIWRCLSLFQLPKAPLAGRVSADASSNWEKNWVPFAVDASRIAVIYSHEPWNVIVIDVSSPQPAFQTAYTHQAVTWDYGTVRGGTPPVPFDDEHLVTFFHSAQVVGSRRVYLAGACVFSKTAPFAPVQQTYRPLLVAPYRTGASRFGWTFAGSVVFPAGAHLVDGRFRLICGRDDGEIATFDIGKDEVVARLEKLEPVHAGALLQSQGAACTVVAARSLLYVADQSGALADFPIVNFLRLVVGRGRTFVEAGAGFGAFTVALSGSFERVIVAPTPSNRSWFEKNIVLNDLSNVAFMERPDAACPAHDADAFAGAWAFDSVDLIKIEGPGRENELLARAAASIAHSRPIVLVKLSDDVSREEVGAALDHAGDYALIDVFPTHPEWALFIPRERQQSLAWFV